MLQFADIPLGPLDLQTPDRQAPDGTLRACENLVPRGSRDQPYLQPAHPPEELADIGDIKAIDWQIRQSRGAYSDDDSSPLERMVIVTDTEILLADPSDWSTTSVCTFSNTESGRKAQMCQIKDRMFIATSVGDEPEETLVLEDDEVLTFNAPMPPHLDMETIEPAVEKPGFLPGLYGVRFAYKFRDGTYGPATPPAFIDISGKPANPIGQTNDAVSNGDTEFQMSGSVGYIQYYIHLRNVKDRDVEGHDGRVVYLNDQRVRVQDVDYVSGNTVFTVEDGERLQSESSGVDVFLERVKAIDFDLTTTPTFPSPNYDRQIHALVVLMSGAVEKHEGAYNEPYFEVSQITTLEAGETFTFYEDAVHLPSYPAYEEGGLTVHNITAASAHSYNSRLLLGDVFYDYRKPTLYTDAQGATSDVRIGVTLGVSGGKTVDRVSEVVGIDSTSVQFEGDVIAYPDRRVEQFHLYVKDGDDFYRVKSWDAQASDLLNISYVVLDGAVDVSSHETDTIDAATVNAENDRDRNRVLISETLQPRNLLARNTHYVGNTDDDTVMAFAANAAAVSEGQWGNYPLLVLCRNSIWAMQTGTGPFIQSKEPITLQRGLVGRYALVNIGRAIFFAAHDGIWELTPQLGRDPVSIVLHDRDADGFVDRLDEDTALGYFNDRSVGRRELWVSQRGSRTLRIIGDDDLASTNICYALSLDHGRWFTLDRDRTDYVLHENTLYGTDGTKLYDEAGGTGGVDIRFATAPLHLGERGIRKRIRRLGVRMDADEDLTWGLVPGEGDWLIDGKILSEYHGDPVNVNQICRSAQVEIEGTVDISSQFESFDIEFSVLQRTVPRRF